MLTILCGGWKVTRVAEVLCVRKSASKSAESSLCLAIAPVCSALLSACSRPRSPPLCLRRPTGALRCNDLLERLQRSAGVASFVSRLERMWIASAVANSSQGDESSGPATSMSLIASARNAAAKAKDLTKAAASASVNAAKATTHLAREAVAQALEDDQEYDQDGNPIYDDQEQIDELHAQIHELKAQLIQYQKSEHSGANSSRENLLDQEEVNDIQGILAAREEETVRLKTQLANVSIAQEQLEQQLLAAEVSVTDSRNAQAAAEERYRLAEEAASEQSKTIEQLEKKIHQSNQSEKVAKMTKSESAADASRMSALEAELQSSKALEEKLMSELNDLNNAWKVDTDALKEERAKARKELDHRDSMVKELEENLLTLRMEASENHAASDEVIGNVTEKCNELERELSEVNDRADSLSKKSEIMSKRVIEAEERAAAAEQITGQLRRELDIERSASKKNPEGMIAGFEAPLSNSAEGREIANKNSDRETEMESKIAELTFQLETCRTKKATELTQMEAEISKLATDLDTAHQDAKKREEMIESEFKILAADLDAAQHSEASARDLIKAAESKHREDAEALQNAKEALQIAEEKVSELAVRLEESEVALTNANANAHKRVDAAEESMTTTAAELELSRSKLDQSLTKITELDSENSELRVALREREMALSEIQVQAARDVESQLNKSISDAQEQLQIATREAAERIQAAVDARDVTARELKAERTLREEAELELSSTRTELERVEANAISAAQERDIASDALQQSRADLAKLRDRMLEGEAALQFREKEDTDSRIAREAQLSAAHDAMQLAQSARDEASARADAIATKLAAAEKRVSDQDQALNNLQSLVTQRIDASDAKSGEVEHLRVARRVLFSELDELEINLSAANTRSNSYPRLEEDLVAVRQSLRLVEDENAILNERLRMVNERNAGGGGDGIDRSLLSQLLVQYYTSGFDPSVLQVLASMLNCSEVERRELGLDIKAITSASQLGDIFTTFLERESAA